MGECLGNYKPLIPECPQAGLEGISGSEKQPSLPEPVAGEKDLGTVRGRSVVRVGAETLSSFCLLPFKTI